MAERPTVTFVTCADLPDAAGEREPITAAMRRRGLECRWEIWDDDAVDWSKTPLVMVRTTWDYSRRRPEFLAWAERVEAVARLVNRASVLAWNTHKGYLAELEGAGVACVPTWIGRAGDPVDPSITRAGRVIVKPAVGAGGIGLAVRSADAVWDGLDGDVDYLVQPVLESVWTEGERSVFVLNGAPIAAVSKRPAPGEIRVQEEYGGDFRELPLDERFAAVAVDAVATARRLVGVELPYARVDFLLDGEWLVSEVELVEPGLYPTVAPQVIEAYADVVADLAADPVR